MINNRDPYSIFLTMGSIVLFLFMFWGIWHLSLSYQNPEQIEEQLKIWNKNKPNSYSYSILSGCMFGSETQVTVKNNREISYKNLDGNTNCTMRIKDMFTNAKRALIEASKVHIAYNKEYGFPEKISVDWNSNFSDDECFYRVDNFTVYKKFN